MTGGYLRQLQLTKQLEKQAKKAAKYREMAEQTLSRAEDSLTTAKEMGAGVAQAEKALVEARDLFSRKDYESALGKASKSLELMEEAKKKTISSVLDSAQGLLEGLGETRGTAGEEFSRLDKARELLSRGELEEAYQTANRAWDKIEQFVNSRMADRFERAQSLLLLAEQQDLDMGSGREQLGQARRSLESGDHHSSIDQINSCLDSVTDALTNHFHSRIQKMRGREERARSLGADLSNVERERAEAELEEGDLEEAFSLLTIAEGELKKAFSRAILTHLSSLGSRVETLRSYEPGLGDLAERVKGAVGQTRSGELESAMEVLEELKEWTRELEADALVSRIARLRPKLQIARRVGAEAEQVLEYLESARTRFREGSFQEAMEEVQDADRHLEEELKEFRELEGELSSTEELMSKGKEFGLDLERARVAVREARKLALGGKVGKAMDQLGSARKNIHHGIQQHLGSRIMELELLLASAMRMGLEVSELSSTVDSLMERVKNGEYDRTQEPLERCHRELESRLKGAAEQALEEAAGEVERYKEVAEVESAEFKVQQAEEALANGDPTRAYHLAKGATEELEEHRSSALDDGLERAKRLMDISKKIGEESSTLERKMARAESLRSEEGDEEVMSLVHEVLRLSGSVVVDWVERGVSSLRRAISTARKRGVEVIAVERMADRIRQRMEEGEVAEAFHQLEEAERTLSEKITQHIEISEYIGEISDLLKQAPSGGEEFDQVRQMLERLKEHFERGEYDQAQEMAGECMSKAEGLLAPLMSPKALREAMNMVATANRLEVDASAEEGRLEEAKELMESGDHQQALQIVEEARGAVENKLNGRMHRELENARELLSRARSSGVDVSSLEKVVGRAGNLLEEGRIPDALRAVELVNQELDQGRLVERKAGEGIDRAQSVIDTVERAGLDPGGASEILRQARDQAREGKSGVAQELAKKAADQAASGARAKLMERLKNLETNSRAMELKGPDLDRALASREEAREKIEQWKFQEALRLLKDMEEELERVDKQRRMSDHTVRETRAKVEESRERGLVSPEIDDLVERSEGKLEQGAFSDAFSLAMRCNDELRAMEDMYDRRRKELDSLRRRMERMADEGKDIQGVRELVEGAERALGDLDFEGVSLNLRRGESALHKVTRSLLEDKLEELGSLKLLHRDLGMDEGEMPPSADLPESPGSEEIDRIKRAIGEMRSLIQARLESRLREAEGRIEMGRKAGADVSGSMELISRAREALEGGRLQESMDSIRESEESIGVAVEKKKEYTDLRMRCQSILERAKRNMMRMREVEEVFDRAEEERKTDHQQAIDSLREALRMAEERADSYLPEIGVDIEFLDRPIREGWMRAVLELTNESRSMARDLEVSMEGPIEVRGLERLKKLRGQESVRMEIEIKPLVSGTVEVQLGLSCRPVLSDDPYGYESTFQIEVE